MKDTFSGIYGLVLAGGQSSRMGQDKTQLKWKDTTLLSSQFDLLTGILGTEKVLVSGHQIGFPAVPDERLNCGPLEGFRCVMQHLNSHHPDWESLIIIPVDMPLLEPHDILHLIDNRRDYDVVKFCDHILPALVCKSPKIFNFCEQTENFTDAKNRSFKNLFSHLICYELEVQQKTSFLNLNTLGEYVEALSSTNVTE